MPLSLYMDHHVARAITAGLRQRRIQVVTAAEDGAADLDDPGLLGCALFSQDEDLLVEAARRQTAGIPFGGVIYAHQLRVPIGVCIRDLELLATIAEADDLRGQVIFLPL